MRRVPGSYPWAREASVAMLIDPQEAERIIAWAQQVETAWEDMPITQRARLLTHAKTRQLVGAICELNLSVAIARLKAKAKGNL
jgi:hypothetical protein